MRNSCTTSVGSVSKATRSLFTAKAKPLAKSENLILVYKSSFLGGYMSERFKRPWMQVNVAAKSDVFVLTEEQRHELIEINRQWLLEHPQEKTVGQNVQQQP